MRMYSAGLLLTSLSVEQIDENFKNYIKLRMLSAIRQSMANVRNRRTPTTKREAFF